MRKHTDISNVTQIFSLLFPTQVPEYDIPFDVFWPSESFLFCLYSPFPKETHCLAFYVNPNSQVENETDKVTSKNTVDYILKQDNSLDFSPFHSSLYYHNKIFIKVRDY